MKNEIKVLSLLLAITINGSIVAQTYYPQKQNSKIKVKPAVPVKAYAFDPKDIRITGGIFLKAMKADEGYLLHLSPDRFLNRFHKNAGLPPKDSLYGGWESLGVSGHSLGHYLSACSMMYASAGNDKLKEKVDYIVSELKRCQDARKTGYVGGIPGEDSIFNEIAKGNINSKGFDLNGGWVPLYTLHKLLAGLEDAYLYCNNTEALSIVIKFADWIDNKFKNLSEAQWQKILITEHGGMNETFANLYAFTGNKKYLSLANKFYHKEVLDTLAMQRDELAGKHSNMEIPKVIGVSRLYELTGNQKDSTIASFFWNTVINHHTYVIGGNSNYEYFHTPDSLSNQLSGNTTETCNTYNMLKLTRHLFGWQPTAQLEDYYERALYNHILASQNHSDGMMCYYVPLLPGSKKVFSTPDSSFWCCTGSGMENHANYGGDIYYEGADGSLYINLFIPSALNWKTKGYRIQQNTSFPTSDKTTFTISAASAKKFSIYVRRPWWATQDFIVRINGIKQKTTSSPSSYVNINRFWQNNDKVEIEMPMHLYTEAIPGDKNKVAMLYGPLVLAGIVQPQTNDNAFDVPVLVTSKRDPATWLQKSKDSLLFHTVNAAKPYEATLVPFYQIQDEKDIVYWDYYTNEDWAKRKVAYEEAQQLKKDLENRTVDVMRIGEMQPERDHNMKGEKTSTGSLGENKWRDAKDGGWFSFDMKVADAAVAQNLVCMYWGSDAGREFNILVDGKRIAAESLNNKKPNQFIYEEYRIPGNLIQNKKFVTVTLQAHKGSTAGGLFGCRIVKAK
jgi:DUF1680 family protein